MPESSAWLEYQKNCLLSDPVEKDTNVKPEKISKMTLVANDSA